jgi:peptidoglycan hydrolase-like protein with peptidoglycan-binding domain
MRTSKLCWLVIGMLYLVLWPVATAVPIDWRIGQAQDRLQGAGFDPGPLDGVLGARTREALRRYQASRGLPATGALDEATRQVLLRGERPPARGEAQPEATRHIPPPSERPPARGEAQPEPLLKAPPGGEYKKMGSLFQLPDFFPGLGTLYVDPATLPVGPYLVPLRGRK